MPRPPEDRFEDEYDGPSRSQRKRDAAELYDLGLELIAMNAEELDALDLPEKLRDAIDLAQTITARGGLARQRNFVAKLLRKVDVEPIRATMERRALEQKLAAREFHRVEQWRDRLVNEGDPAVEALLQAEPALDAKRLRALVAEARAEQAAGRAPTASRTLFRWLRETLAAAPPAAG